MTARTALSLLMAFLRGVWLVSVITVRMQTLKLPWSYYLQTTILTAAHLHLAPKTVIDYAPYNNPRVLGDGSPSFIKS